MTRGILFDKDGTLFDFGASWEGWARAFIARMASDDTHARAIAEAVDFDYDKGVFRKESVVIAGMPSEIAEALLPVMPDMTADQIETILNEEAARAPQAEAVPLKPFLARLQAAGMKLGVATNDAEAPALAHLEGAGVKGMFDFIAGFDSGFGGKPATGQMEAFCKALGLTPSACVMVGDSLHDLLAGRAAGFTCVAVLTGMASEEELAPYADVVLPDIGHIPEWLGIA